MNAEQAFQSTESRTRMVVEVTSEGKLHSVQVFQNGKWEKGAPQPYRAAQKKLRNARVEMSLRILGMTEAEIKDWRNEYGEAPGQARNLVFAAIKSQRARTR